MRRTIGLLLLLIQLGPLAAAGLCLHAASRPVDHCATPMEGSPSQETNQSHHGPGQDCALMVLCAPATPVVAQIPIQFFGLSEPGNTLFSAPASLFPGDPIAPPQPPPIA